VANSELTVKGVDGKSKYWGREFASWVRIGEKISGGEI